MHPIVLLFIIASYLESVTMAKVDHERQRYPASIVWTPIPCLTWLFPFIGHMGIATSEGIIRDFAGPYYVSEDNMAFGAPTKYWPLDPSLAVGGVSAYDKAVSEASEIYKGRGQLVVQKPIPEII